MTITNCRMEIDDIDNQVLRLLNQRAKLAATIGELKTANNQPLKDETRERRLLARLAEVNAGPLDNAAVSAIFQQIIVETRRLEAQLFAASDRNSQRRKRRSLTQARSVQRNPEFHK